MRSFYFLLGEFFPYISVERCVFTLLLKKGVRMKEKIVLAILTTSIPFSFKVGVLVPQIGSIEPNK